MRITSLFDSNSLSVGLSIDSLELAVLTSQLFSVPVKSQVCTSQAKSPVERWVKCSSPQNTFRVSGVNESSLSSFESVLL